MAANKLTCRTAELAEPAQYRCTPAKPKKKRGARGENNPPSHTVVYALPTVRLANFFLLITCFKPLDVWSENTVTISIPTWLLWWRPIITFKLYFCSHKLVFEQFSLFCKRRSEGSRRLFSTKALVFHPHMSEIFNYRRVHCDKRQQPLLTFLPFCKFRLSRGKLDPRNSSRVLRGSR